MARTTTSAAASKRSRLSWLNDLLLPTDARHHGARRRILCKTFAAAAACGKLRVMANTLPSRDRYARIWAMVRQIPRGRVASYGQVAAAAGFSRQPRLAAQALHHAPTELALPWHRVLRASGQLAFAAGSAGYRQQKARLEDEGVIFVGARVDLDACGWRPQRLAPFLD